MQPSQLTWTAIAAVVIGGLVRAIKSDGMTIALANLGLPPIPKRALPWVALTLGAAAAVLDSRQLGATWQEAAVLGVVATATAVLGHDLGKGVPGLGKVLVFALVAGAGVTACGPSKEAQEAAAAGTYAIEHMNCVEKYDTNAEINACRDEVRRRWGIVTTVTKDAGADR